MDDKAQVDWFGHKNELWVLDLLAPSATPQLLARYQGDEPITVAYGKDLGEQLGVLVSVYDSHLVLKMIRTPTLAFASGLYDDHWKEQRQQNCGRLSRITWVEGARERLKGLARRAQGRRLFLPKPEAPPASDRRRRPRHRSTLLRREALG